MDQTPTTTIKYLVQAKDQAGNWHPFSQDVLVSREAAEEFLAQQVDKISVYFVEARIVQQTINTSISNICVKHTQL